MKVRHKERGTLASSGDFNLHAASEIIVYYDGGDADSDYIKNFDVELPDGTWKDLAQAFRDSDVITDNFNTRFFVPRNEDDRNRGYAL